MFVNLATEDELSESVAQRLIQFAIGDGVIGNKLGRKGNGYLRSKLPSFLQMASREPVFILTDLDRVTCPPELVREWMGSQPINDNLLFRVAVREIEAWILADRVGTANFLGLSPNLIPANPEEIADPKLFLLNLARRAKRDVRSELIVARGSVASQGLGYNRVLSTFVTTDWAPDRAAQSSVSLAKAILRLQELANR